MAAPMALRAHLLLSLCTLLAACGSSEAPAAASASKDELPRVLVVGWDGASWRWIDPLLAAGRLPNLARLVTGGVRAPLESTRIPISASAWTTAFTGVGSGHTGVFSFFEPEPGSYALRLVSARSNRAVPIWRRLTARGIPALVFGVPLTYPPEPLLGTMVCGMLAPTGSAFTWPPELAPVLRARGYTPDVEPWLTEDELLDEALLAQLRLRVEILREQLHDEDWRLAWVVFKELDVVSHLSYGEDYARHVEPILGALDEALGALLEEVDLARTTVLLVSDHGFATYTHGLNLHELLISEGLAVRRADASIEPLPEGPLARTGPAEAEQRLEELDLSRTRALAWACEGNLGSVRLNRSGREPQGIVDDAGVVATLADCEQRLGAHPWVVRTFRATDLLPGPERDALPDLLVETRPDVQLFAEHGAPLSGTYPSPLADHDLTGILVLAGRGVGRRGLRVEEPAALVDLVPTILHLLGETVPSELPGTVPEPWLTSGPVRRAAASAATAVRARAPSSPYTPEELEALERELARLGYGR
jgi:predicted AlkP superfamily phosphohydrolase/phosphomutase